MNDINKLGVFIDKNVKKWHKINSKDCVIMTEEEPLIGTATLLSRDQHRWFTLLI